MCSRRDGNCSDGNLDSEFIVARGGEDLDLLREKALRFLPRANPQGKMPLCLEAKRQGAFPFPSLDNHLTLDFRGNVRFGPNIE